MRFCLEIKNLVIDSTGLLVGSDNEHVNRQPKTHFVSTQSPTSC